MLGLYKFKKVMIEVNSIYNTSDYKRSRAAYAAQCTFEYFVSLLVADAFLAKLLSSIGISDALVGIISSFISLAFVIQIFSIFLMRAKVSKKKLVIVFDSISQIFFCAIYFLPMANLGKTAKTVLIMLCILVAYVGKYLISNIYFKWANSFVDPKNRASYSAKKELISLASGIIFSAVIGYVIDRYEGVGNLDGGFLFIGISMLILNVCNLVSLLLIKTDDKDEGDNVPIAEVFKNTFGNKNFRNLLIMTVLWECARYFSIGFMGIYKTKELLMSVFLVQLVNIASSVARMAISIPFGRYSDKKSFAKGFELAMVIAAVGFLMVMFTVPKTWYFIVLHTILYNASMAGINQNGFNITYSYVDLKYVTQAMAIKYSIGGIFGFLASILGGKILAMVQVNGNTFLGIHMYGQQLLAFISFALTVIAIVFVKLVIEKQKVKVQ